jgi:hypothetical protein
VKLINGDDVTAWCEEEIPNAKGPNLKQTPIEQAPPKTESAESLSLLYFGIWRLELWRL